MGYRRQDNFSLGEVDEINYNETSSKLYMRSLKSALNFFINATGKAVKRPGFKNIVSLSDTTVGPKLSSNSRFFKFQTDAGEYYLVIATNLAFDFYKISDGTFASSVVTPYTNAQLKYLQATTGENNTVFTEENHPPARLFESGGTFSYIPISFVIQPSYDFNKLEYGSFDATMAGGSTTTFTLTLSGVPGSGFTTDWIGGTITGGGTSVTDPIGYGIITGVSSTTVTVFTGTVRIDFADGTFKADTYSIQQPVFTAALGYPRTAIFYQNRLWFGNTRSLPNTVFGSRINKFDNFDLAVGRDSDAIIYTIGDTNAGEIKFLNAGKQIEIYTQHQDLVAPQPAGQALTPTTFYIKPQSSFGINDICPPINYENDSYYVAKDGKALYRFEFQGLGEAYRSTNVSIAASHLIKQPIRKALLQSKTDAQETYIFLLNSDHSLTVYQYSAVASINAFMPLILGGNNSDIEIYDIVDINNELYLLVYLVTSSRYILARFDKDYYHDLYQVKTLPANGVITGLTDYEGYDVSVVYSGQDFGTYTVSSGQITVDNPNQLTGNCTVGITYPIELKTLSLYTGDDSSDVLKKSSYAYADYYESIDFKVNGKQVPFQTFEQIQQGLPIMPQTGRFKLGTSKGYSLTEEVTVSQYSPMPCTITALSYQVKGELI